MRLGGFVALLGFLAASLWSAGLVPMSCCDPAAGCPACPTSMCKSASDMTPSAPQPAIVQAGLLPGAGTVFLKVDPSNVARVPSHAVQFALPMRN